PGGVPPGGGCGGAIVSKAHRWLDNAAAAKRIGHNGTGTRPNPRRARWQMNTATSNSTARWMAQAARLAALGIILAAAPAMRAQSEGLTGTRFLAELRDKLEGQK